MNTPSTRTATCAVIGAGIAGLLAARKMQDRGLDIIVVDKARGVGGRMATRRLQPGRCDHGAQSFTATTSDFRELTEQWLAGGCLKLWFGDQLCGVDGMTSLPRYLAEGLDIRLQHRVTRLEPAENHWHLTCENGARISAATVLITCPAPQARQLLERSGSGDIPDNIEQIAYGPCFALMGVIDDAAAIPVPGTLTFGESIIRRITDNQSKGISPDRRTATVLSTGDFARSSLEEEPEHVIERIQQAVADAIGRPLTESQLHRWRYSEVRQSIDAYYSVITDSPLLVCAGDGFGGSGVEAAALSGLRAAETIVAGRE